MPIQPKPDRKGGIGVGLPEGGTPFGIPQVKIEMVGVGHLPAPIHVGMNSVFLSFARPRAPDRSGPRDLGPLSLRLPNRGEPVPLCLVPSEIATGESSVVRQSDQWLWYIAGRFCQRPQRRES